MSPISVVRRYPLLSYFALAYALSGLALAVVGWPRLDGATARPTLALVMFPVMVVGVGLIGLALTAATGGRAGLRDLRSRLLRWRLGRYALILLLPPLGILAVLTAFRVFVSPRFAPQFLAFGIAAGIVAGFCEEIGWTGFAYPRLRARFGAVGGALLLGVLWGLWHAPVVDAMGAASPHGQYWPAFFTSFVALVVAMRVLIAWLYANTGSVLGAQLLHASSTGFLVVLGAARVSPGEEALWYLVYALLLWMVVGLLVATSGPSLARAQRARRPRSGEALATRGGGAL